MEIIKKGILLQDKEMPYQKCAICRSKLHMKIYRYNGKLEKIVVCPKCNTYLHLKKKKGYNTNIKPIHKPDFLK